ncbi:putative nima interactive protein [Phaeomoniella chlamydospora]|uniref:Putative nima interactive protein n=1 Tax=Phaeomoniella chlamydospora TaxID=158046 RepID=A0A0G2E5U4_PHACM|nr:putative nima interactive protein [Phaeomoniella chlamydospora]
MEQHSLQTASAYLNNLLLARGLLRNGKSIDFARPDKASGGTDATMAKVINLVHDLVLRRDREAEQHELLAGTIRTLRINESQHAAEIDRMQSKCDEFRRNLTAAEAQQRSLKASARKAESGAKELRDQMQRMKSTLDQVRSKCQSDVRKRDIELEKLKTHLVNLQRGKRDATGMNLISIAPQLRDVRPPPDTSSPHYTLEQETNAFLASFVKSLNADLEATSSEHKWLLYLIKRSMQELEEMMGAGGEDEESPELGLTFSKQKVSPPNCPSTQTYEDLATELNRLLEHCGSIMTNPSYVSIEEVEIRENEIVKLREGWEKMAGRLKEALMMMDTWRRRMIEGGETVNLEELGMGMDLGRSIAVPQLGQSDSGVDAGSSSILDGIEELDDSERLFGLDVRESLSKATDESIEDGIEAAGAVSNQLETTQSHGSARGSGIPQPQVPGRHLASSPARRGIRLLPPKSALAEIDDNIVRPSPSKRRLQSPRKVSFDDDIPPKAASSKPARDNVALEIDMNLNEDNADDSLSFEQILAEEAAKVASSSSSAHAPRLTITQKLAIAAAEAKEAETEAELMANKKRKRTGKSGIGKRGRRRSTLNPEELEELMGVR